LSEDKPRLTEEQERALQDIEASLCLVAGAGSGKTLVLVERLVRILEQKKAHIGQVVAITFTERAARQLKERVRRVIEERVASSGPEERPYWRRQRLELEGSRIGTIHSFCASLLRERSFEAKVPPDFSILEDAPCRLAFRKCIDEVLRRKMREGERRTLHLAEELGFWRLRRHLERLFQKRIIADEAARRFAGKSPDEVIEVWRKALEREKVEILTGLIRHPAWRGAIETLERYEGPAGDAREIMRRTVLKLDHLLCEAKNPAEMRRTWQEIAPRLNRRGGSAKKWGAGAYKSVGDALATIKTFRDRARDVLELEIGEGEKRASSLMGEFLSLYGDVRSDYEARKAELGLLDFDDLLTRTRDLLKESPEALRYIRERTRFLLVDEFQDCSPVEGEIFSLICAPGGRLERFFAVGDDRQSIYRFRGADVSVFNRLRAEMESSGRVQVLERNFRSTPALVTFLNKLFGSIMGREVPAEDYVSRYEDQRAHRKEALERTGEIVVFAPPEAPMEEARSAEASWIAWRIQRMVSKGERLVFEKPGEPPRAVSYKDVALLLRSFSNIGIYERAFQEQGIPYYLISGNGFYARPEIGDILNFLKVLDSPLEVRSLTGLLRSPFFSISDSALYALARAGLLSRFFEDSIEAPLLPEEERQRVILARETLCRLRFLKDNLAFDRLLREIISSTSYDEFLLTQFMGERRLFNLEKLIERARTFWQTRLFSFSDFVSSVAEFVSIETAESEVPVLEEEADAVKIMTVHKAKGLEFPVVFLADTARKPNHSAEVIHPDFGVSLPPRPFQADKRKSVPDRLLAVRSKREEEAEEKRVFYVAASRARDYLVISAALPAREGYAGSWLSQLEAAISKKVDSDAGTISFGDFEISLQKIDKHPRHSRRKPAKSFAERYGSQISEGKKIPAKAQSQVERLLRLASPIALDLSLKRHFTATELNDYWACPRHYFLRHILSFPESLTAGNRQRRSLLFGNLIHKAIEAWDGADSSLDACLERASREVYPMAGSAVLLEARKLLSLFRESDIFEVLRTARNDYREVSFSVLFNGVILEGKMDRLLEDQKGELLVVDFKSDPLQPRAARKHSSRYLPQLRVYLAACERLFGRPPSRLILHYLRTGQTLDLLESEPPGKMKRSLASMIDKIRSGEFPRSQSHENCPMKRFCDLLKEDCITRLLQEV